MVQAPSGMWRLGINSAILDVIPRGVRSQR